MDSRRYQQDVQLVEALRPAERRVDRPLLFRRSTTCRQYGSRLPRGSTNWAGVYSLSALPPIVIDHYIL